MLMISNPFETLDFNFENNSFKSSLELISGSKIKVEASFLLSTSSKSYPFMDFNH